MLHEDRWVTVYTDTESDSDVIVWTLSDPKASMVAEGWEARRVLLSRAPESVRSAVERGRKRGAVAHGGDWKTALRGSPALSPDSLTG